MAEANQVTFIEDREGDIFEQFARVADDKHQLIVRSRTTRKIAGDKKMYQEVAQQPVLGIYKIELPTDSRKDQYKRTATIELRMLPCQIHRPTNLKTKQYPESFELTLPMGERSWAG